MKIRILPRILLMLCLAFISMLCIKPMDANAATPKIWDLKEGRADVELYKPGEFDEVSVETDEYGGYIITNSANKVLSFEIDEEYQEYEAKLIRLKNGQILLYIKDRVSEGVGRETMYWHNGLEFVKIANLHVTGEDGSFCDGWCRVRDIKVSGNTVKVYSYYDSKSLGVIDVKFEYKFEYTKSGAKLKKSPTAGWIKKVTQCKKGNTFYSNTMTTANKLTAYKTATGKSKKMSIKKGAKVYVDRIYYSSKYGMRVRVKYHKKYGWVKLSKHSDKKIFKYICHPE